jgi:hypothetical protein
MVRLVGHAQRSGERVVGLAHGFAHAPAGGRQHHPPARTVEELHAELALQAAQTLADPRLREAEPRGCPAEVQLLGEHEEHADLTELDQLPHPVARLLAAMPDRRLMARRRRRTMHCL